MDDRSGGTYQPHPQAAAREALLLRVKPVLGISCRETRTLVDSPLFLLSATAAEYIIREHHCNFEPPAGSCGWQQSDLVASIGESGIVQAAVAPHNGPPVDANPGREDGELLNALL